jgi:hypothetical protein
MLTAEFYELAELIFNVMPPLRVLAFGDFTSLDPAGRLVLCREDAGLITNGTDGGYDYRPPFRLLREDDGEVLDLLEEYADSLLAGPDYSKPFLRAAGASMSRSVWRRNLVARIARESAYRDPTIPGALSEGAER